jgi:hypothetical protein
MNRTNEFRISNDSPDEIEGAIYSEIETTERDAGGNLYPVFSTQQYFTPAVYDALERAARARPDYMITVKRMSYVDNLVFTRIIVRVPGKILFIRKLTSFIVLALTDYYIRH